MYQQLIDDFIQQERLPATYAEDAQRCFLPLLPELASAIRAPRPEPFLLGINGAQGTGKSTLAKLLCTALRSEGFRVANLSIDDFYYSKARRQQLAAEIHPLLASRGVPGSHDVQLALRVLQQLGSAEAGESVTLPGFDKSTDDCLPAAACQTIEGPIDAVILEGWFVGAAPQSEDELAAPINALERDEDADGRWRRYVNTQLAGDYQTLFARLDRLYLLEAPDFEAVLEWRSLQEEKLRRHAAVDAGGLMDEKSIARFIAHFERLSRHCLRTLPGRAEKLFKLDREHRVRCA